MFHVGGVVPTDLGMYVYLVITRVITTYIFSVQHPGGRARTLNPARERDGEGLIIM